MKKIVFYIDSMRMGGEQRVIKNLIEYYSKEDYELNNLLLQRQFNELKKSKMNELIERENKLKEKSIKEKDKIIEEYTKKFSDFDNEKKKY